MKVSPVWESRRGWRPVSNLLKEILTIGGSPLLGNLIPAPETHPTSQMSVPSQVLRKDSPSP